MPGFHSIALLLHAQPALALCPASVSPVALHPLLVEIIVLKTQISQLRLRPCRSWAVSLSWLYRLVRGTTEKRLLKVVNTKVA